MRSNQTPLPYVRTAASNNFNVLKSTTTCFLCSFAHITNFTIILALKTEILTIGDEILIGQIVDTNSAWIAQKLMSENIRVNKMISLADEREEMLEVIDQSFKRADIIIITGGLGPTKDDLTKAVLASYFNSGWRWDNQSIAIIEEFFALRNRTLKEINKKQAYLPDNCETILNYWGTAPGMLFRKNGKLLVSLPGVPYEMQQMMETYVIPIIKNAFTRTPLLTHHFITVNIPESILSEKLAFVEDVLPPHMKLAYLPNLNMVRLRLNCDVQNPMNDKNLFENFITQIRNKLGNAIVTESHHSLEAYIKEELESRKQSISFAESCTGGLIASRFTQLSGISAVFPGSVVSYSNTAKIDLLNVNAETIEKHGAVSENVTIEMAKGCKERFNTDYAIAVSGIAGPSGGSPEKPVGTVCISIASPTKISSQTFYFPGERSRIMERTFIAALDMLRNEIS
jgi:nicotinamide-nucleotide amidase